MSVVRNVYLSLLLILIPLVGFSQTPAPSPALQRTIIHAGKVLDVHTGTAAANQAIIVSGDKIVSVGPDQPAQSGDREIDLRAMTVMPGMIDVHTHLTMDTNF